MGQDNQELNTIRPFPPLRPYLYISLCGPPDSPLLPAPSPNACAAFARKKKRRTATISRRSELSGRLMNGNSNRRYHTTLAMDASRSYIGHCCHPPVRNLIQLLGGVRRPSKRATVRWRSTPRDEASGEGAETLHLCCVGGCSDKERVKLLVGGGGKPKVDLLMQNLDAVGRYALLVLQCVDCVILCWRSPSSLILHLTASVGVSEAILPLLLFCLFFAATTAANGSTPFRDRRGTPRQGSITPLSKGKVSYYGRLPLWLFSPHGFAQ